MNQDLSQTRASIVRSDVTSAGNVSLSAVNDSDLDATVVMTALSFSLGKPVAVGVSIGSAVARNLIGFTESGERVGTPVQAFVQNSSIDTAGSLNLHAWSTARINSAVGAGAAAIAATTTLYSASVAVAGAGAGTDNRIAYDTQAYIDGDSTGISVGSLSLSASDTSTINAETGSVAVAANLALFGASVSVGAAVSENTIDNQVGASILNAAHVHTTGGDIFLSASESALATSSTFAATGVLGVSVGAAIANAVTVAENTLTNNVHADIKNSSLSSARNVTLRTFDTSSIDSTIRVATGVLGVATIGVGASNAHNTVGGSTVVAVDGSTVTAGGSGDIDARATASRRSPRATPSARSPSASVSASRAAVRMTASPARSRPESAMRR